jgi:serine protease AprX
MASKKPPQRGRRPATNPLDDARTAGFDPWTLDRAVIAIPLLKKLPGVKGPIPVIIDLNLDYPEGRNAARERLNRTLARIRGQPTAQETGDDGQYVYTELEAEQILDVVRQDEEQARGRLVGDQSATKAVGRDGFQDAAFRRFLTVYRIWEDFEVTPLLIKSVFTVKADAARAAFDATGANIVWAVIDSGVQGDHVHFQGHRNLEFGVTHNLHQDFTLAPTQQPLEDSYGHGTHVAGIIAGELKRGDQVTIGGRKRILDPLKALIRARSNGGGSRSEALDVENIRGVAPRCSIVSLKVLDADGKGRVSGIIKALGWIQGKNGYGRRLIIHGVNISVGYTFDPEWFACGQSPLCVEIDRLVRSGVVVVVAAGNSGYRKPNPQSLDDVDRFGNGVSHSINDPGNADGAITVGATHREMPHTYGVSYFSSKGPTGDGRLKPDLLAPGERIISAACGQIRQELMSRRKADDWHYGEQSGTSVAAPHVSGAVAAFLSVRREFINRPDAVKQVFLSTATDLKRDRYAQGHGLVDLMRAIQSV